MGKVGALCLTVLLVSIVESRPSQFESVTEVIFTENIEVTSSTEYAIVTEDTKNTTRETNNIGGTFAEERSTETFEVLNTTGNVDLATGTTDTSPKNVDVPSATEDTDVETTTVFDVTTATQDLEIPASTEMIEVAKTTEDAATETTADLADVTITIGTTDITVSTTTGTTDYVDATTTSRDINPVTSTEAVEVATTDDATLESTTKLIADTTTAKGINIITTTENVQVANATIYAAKHIADYTDATSAAGDMEQISTESFEGTYTRDSEIGTQGAIKLATPVTLGTRQNEPILNSSDIKVVTPDTIRTRTNEPEPFVNSSVILPCFTANARRGITPFIAHAYDLDAELAEWKRRNLPTKIAFMNNDNSIHFVDLTDRLQTSTFGPTVKVYEDKVFFYLHTRHGNGSGVKLSMDTGRTLESGFDPTLPTKVIAHGYWSDMNSPSIQKLVNAYINTGNYNVITVDWSSLAYGFYPSAIEEAHGVGDYLGQFLRLLVYVQLVDPKKLHLIGHSLGAHLVGFAGKRAHQDGWGILRITGLDPALPFYTTSDHTGRLDSSDADIVDVIHTCAAFLGMTAHLGDIDFYPNEGTNFQPGCNLDVFGICSHGRAVEYFAESVSEPLAFVGKFCDGERSDILVKADNCPGTPAALMGERLKFSQPGRYILRTAARPPYGVGFDPFYPSRYWYIEPYNLSSNSTAVFMELHT